MPVKSKSRLQMPLEIAKKWYDTIYAAKPAKRADRINWLVTDFKKTRRKKQQSSNEKWEHIDLKSDYCIRSECKSLDMLETWKEEYRSSAMLKS